MLALEDDTAPVPFEDHVEAEHRRTRMASLKLLRTIQRQHPERFPEARPTFVKPRIAIPSARAIILRPSLVSFGRDLIAGVAAAFEIDPEEIRGTDRRSHFVEARAVIAATLRQRGWSYPQIGNLLRRDHSSVINLVSKLDIYCRRSETCNDVWIALKPYRTKRGRQ